MTCIQRPEFVPRRNCHFCSNRLGGGAIDAAFSMSCQARNSLSACSVAASCDCLGRALSPSPCSQCVSSWTKQFLLVDLLEFALLIVENAEIVCVAFDLSSSSAETFNEVCSVSANDAVRPRISCKCLHIPRQCLLSKCGDPFTGSPRVTEVGRTQDPRCGWVILTRGLLLSDNLVGWR